MSRSNPQQTLTNPATRWMEWNGELGLVRYYDKEKKENVDLGADLTFLLLDQMGCVNGWDESAGSSIYSNEVRDSRAEVLVVKSFKGGTIAEGLYKAIKDRVKVAGGSFHANCYVAYKNGAALSIGSLKFKGAALHAWAEFTKANREGLDTKAVKIDGFTEGKKGRIVFRVPIFKLVPTSADTHATAVVLDKQLQAFLESYLKRNKREQVETVPDHHVSDEEIAQPNRDTFEVLDDDSIPF